MPKNPITTSRVSNITETIVYTFTDADILAALRETGQLPEGTVALDRKRGCSEDVTVTVRVPGGGDWSNTDLDICEDHPLTVMIVRERREVQ